MRWVIIMLMIVLAGCTNVTENERVPAEDDVNINEEEVIEEPVVEEPTEEELLAEEVVALSIDEKIGQLIIAGFPGVSVTDDVRSLIEDTYVGGFILFRHNLETAEQAVSLLNGLKEVNGKNTYPLIMSVDQEGGRVTRLPELAALPSNLRIAQTGIDGAASEYGRLIGEQVKAYGFNMDFAPVLDVNNEPNNPVIGDRAFGDRAEIVEESGVEMLLSMQQTGVVPVAKHFPGHGDVTVDSHVGLPEVNKTLDELSALELVPFHAAIEAGADAMMVGHILLPQLDEDLPASMSPAVITNILREQFAFDGVVITDDMTMGAIANSYTMEAAAIKMIEAGVDMLLVAGGSEMVQSVVEHIKEQVENGVITEARLDESVMRIIRLKRQYEMTDAPISNVDVEQLNEEITQFMELLSE